MKIDMVKQFPQEYMHLVCLGVMRKLLFIWSGKKRGRIGRLSPSQINELNFGLKHSEKFWPSDFVRKPRSTKELDHWKATEFRQFLLYLGPLLLRDVLTNKMYDHFMMFSCAITFLVSHEYCMKYNKVAQKMLKSFVRESEELYGENFISYNVHSLIHLPDDVLNFGALDQFSSFPFENHLQILKKKTYKIQSTLATDCKKAFGEA
nr:uncharacterized protein LOC122273300 [Parasteatoda tepidariorum]